MTPRTHQPLAAHLFTLALACAPPTDDAAKSTGPDTADDASPPNTTDTTDTPGPSGDTPTADTPSDTPTAGDTAPEASAPSPPGFGAGFTEVLLATLLSDGASAPPSSIPNRELGELTTVLPADLDADGSVELIVSEVLLGSAPPNWHAVYRRNSSGTWTYDAVWTAKLRTVRRGVVGALDLDDDGAVDLLRASYEAPITLARGTTFQPQLPAMPDGLRPLGGYQRVGVADLDRDGWLDIWFLPNSCSNTTARAALAFYRTGVATWTWVDGVFPEDLRPNAYALGAFPGFDGAPDRLLWVASGCEATDHPSTVLEPVGALAGRTVWGHVDPFPMGSVFRYDPTAPFMPLGARQPMGAALFDLHGDGVFEYLVSLSDPHLHGFSTGLSGWTDLTPTLADPLPFGPNQTFQLPWAIGPIDLDRDGRADAVVALGDDMDAFTAPVRNGPYAPLALWNDGLGHLVDVSSSLPLGVPGWQHTLRVDDIDGDADPDLLVGGIGDLPRVLRNDVDTGGRVLAVRLHGTTSNAHGFGARLRLQVAGLPDQWQLLGATASEGLVPSEFAYFALGPNDETTQLTIDWPSGVRQEVGPLLAGQTHHITEPETIHLSEVDRHAPADGVSEIVVSVTPRDAQGAPRAAAVTIETDPTTNVGAPWMGAVTAVGDHYERRLRAPSTEHATRILVTIDGIPSGIAPRVWWDAP
jgi:hypothetical protein